MYILERKKQGNRQGNTLSRPSLLLNPWVLSQTDTTGTSLLQTESLKCADMPSQLLNSFDKKSCMMKSQNQSTQTFKPNLEFLENQSVVLENLVPQNGLVEVDLAKLGNGTLVRIIAVDNTDFIGKSVGLKLTLPKFRDLRLSSRALNPNKHFTEQKRISVVLGQSNEDSDFVIKDLSTSSLQVVII